MLNATAFEDRVQLPWEHLKCEKCNPLKQYKYWRLLQSLQYRWINSGTSDAAEGNKSLMTTSTIPVLAGTADNLASKL